MDDNYARVEPLITRMALEMGDKALDLPPEAFVAWASTYMTRRPPTPQNVTATLSALIGVVVRFAIMLRAMGDILTPAQQAALLRVVQDQGAEQDDPDLFAAIAALLRKSAG